MTETLKTLMHDRAAGADFTPVDLDATFRDGDRVVRRRRTTSLVGGLAALALVGGLAAGQLGATHRTRSAPVATDPGTAQRVTWALGRTIHDGGRTTELGFDVTAYVRTASGVVATGPDGTVYSVVGADATPVGHTDAKHPRLVADASGSLAGWIDRVDLDGTPPQLVVLDQDTGEVTRSAVAQDPTDFYAIDGRTAYWRDRRGAVAGDLDSGAVRVVDPDAAGNSGILDVDHGLIAFDAGDAGTAIGRTRQDAMTIPDTYGDIGVLSPGGAYFSSDADDPQVFDARTGARVNLGLRYAFATGYAWLDAHTLVLIAQKDKAAPVQLLTCQVPEGGCTTAVADLGSFDDLAAKGFALPVGQRVGD